MASTAFPSRVVDMRPAFAAILAVASITAGAIHASAAPHHLAESATLGAAFVSTAVFQVLWALPTTAHPGRWVFDVGATVNGAVVVAWIWSRTLGLPLGPHAWVPEAAGPLDVSATMLELVLVAGYLLLPTDDREAQGASPAETAPQRKDRLRSDATRMSSG